MLKTLVDVTGFQGEKIVELRLTDYREFKGPLFRPGFLGDKWPSIDFYVELNGVQKRTPYFLVQAKSTAKKLKKSAKNLAISTKRKDVRRLLKIPGPTYILGVHVPTQRVFARSVHAGVADKAITRIPLSHELTPKNLKVLHNEVKQFWATVDHKPKSSEFA